MRERGAQGEPTETVTSDRDDLPRGQAGYPEAEFRGPAAGTAVYGGTGFGGTGNGDWGLRGADPEDSYPARLSAEPADRGFDTEWDTETDSASGDGISEIDEFFAGFDAFKPHTWTFQPAPPPWYRRPLAATALTALVLASMALVVSGVLLLFHLGVDTGSRPAPPPTPTAPSAPPRPQLSPSRPAPPPPAPPPPAVEAESVNPAPAPPPQRQRSAPSRTGRPEIGVTRTPVTRSPISVAPNRPMPRADSPR